MKTFISIVLASSFFATTAIAAAPADAPPNTTGQCKDGTFWSKAEKKGACKGHQGVKEWYGDAATASKTSESTADKPSRNREPADTTASKSTSVPGGSAGQVWVNESTKVYHCSGDRWYGKTKHGAYMSEADAKTKGFRADHGKACSA